MIFPRNRALSNTSRDIRSATNIQASPGTFRGIERSPSYPPSAFTWIQASDISCPMITIGTLVSTVNPNGHQQYAEGEAPGTEFLPSGTWLSASCRKNRLTQPIKYVWLLPSSKRIVPARTVYLHTSNPPSEDATLRLEHYSFMNLMTQCNSYGQGLGHESKERF
ncbi:hypothetical protein BDZ45DRAFT_738841 [Acephala macrosclerotiorum]|nr:hypothetical protein BDZ45DRAFT_738841 [Acephala macrosclerotiorum]